MNNIENYGYDLGIVIISMNNPQHVLKCIRSIYKYHSANKFEIHLIAYNYLEENIELILSNFPNVIITKSFGIKGFAENNNIVLKKITKKYCLVLNDDTYFSDSSIEKLVCILRENEHIDIISPIILYPNGSKQFEGRHKYNLFGFVLHELQLGHYLPTGDNNSDLFQTYNVSGACFIIKNEVLKVVGYFDEKYFFCPEDVALSTKAIRMGFNCYVTKKAIVYHVASSTAKQIHQITIPVAKQGVYLFLQEYYGRFQANSMRIFICLLSIMRIIYLQFKKSSPRRNIILESKFNLIKYAFSTCNPKELFVKISSKYN